MTKRSVRGMSRSDAALASGHSFEDQANNEAKPRIKIGVREIKKRLPKPTAPYHHGKQAIKK
jgi:hypothetical protein